MKILLIEDDILWQTKLEMIIEEIGLNLVGKTTNLADTRTFLSEFSPDLIVTDVMLGNEIIFDLFSTEQYTDIPVLFITQSTNPIYYQKARQLKKSHFLVKPFHALTLQASIEMLVKNNDALEMEDLAGLAVKGKYNEKIILKPHQIVYAKQDRNYCFIKTMHQQFALKTSLTNVLKELGREFIQINRNWAVNKKFIEKLEMNRRNLRVNGEIIAIGRSFKEDVLKYMASRNPI